MAPSPSIGMQNVAQELVFGRVVPNGSMRALSFLIELFFEWNKPDFALLTPSYELSWHFVYLGCLLDRLFPDDVMARVNSLE